ncbi:hypothetical protein COB11_06225 [Candidatus Aerophobetes bacterium]|uniref:DUF3300 domain-containing protein n=1 Tax=Aerophobetes bacterium TaxID=2030807 RepID=A0A2A4YDT8_UNCAE|nr:MAG: hypothetical protein COB11_06225 [Candidatus Aerophobetes bacterium]
MENKRLVGAFVAAAIGLSPMLAIADASSPYMHRKQQVEDARRPQPSQMTTQEKQFAMKLSDLHRQIFVYQFTPSQRQETMALVTTNANRGWRSTKITPEMAVEEVIKNHRGISTGQGQTDMKNESGSGYYKKRNNRQQGSQQRSSSTRNSQQQRSYGSQQRGSQQGNQEENQQNSGYYNQYQQQRPHPRRGYNNQSQQQNQQDGRIYGGSDTDENWQEQDNGYQSPSRQRGSQNPREIYEDSQNERSQRNYNKRDTNSPYSRSKKQQQRQPSSGYSYSETPSSSYKSKSKRSEKKMQRSQSNRSKGYWYNSDSSPSSSDSSKSRKSNKSTQRGYWD